LAGTAVHTVIARCCPLAAPNRIRCLASWCSWQHAHRRQLRRDARRRSAGKGREVGQHLVYTNAARRACSPLPDHTVARVLCAGPPPGPQSQRRARCAFAIERVVAPRHCRHPSGVISEFTRLHVHSLTPHIDTLPGLRHMQTMRGLSSVRRVVRHTRHTLCLRAALSHSLVSACPESQAASAESASGLYVRLSRA
jgi:hypothetical protein